MLNAPLYFKMYKSSRSQMFFKIGVFKNFKIFTGKHLCWSLFLIMFQASTLQVFKKRLQHRGFPVKFAKFLEHLFWRTSAGDCFSITFLQFCSECENIIFDVVCWTSGRLWKIRRQWKRAMEKHRKIAHVRSCFSK